MALTTEAALRKDKTNAGATMEHRHFATIAAIIGTIEKRTVRNAVAARFSRELARTNPQFDRDRFMRACGVES